MARIMWFSRFTAVWLLGLGLLGCAVESARTGSGPRVWIDLPLNGDTLSQSAIIVQSHASDRSGVTQAELYVNGTPVRSDLMTNSSDRLVKIEQPWTPPGFGDYVLVVRAKNGAGAYGHSEPARIRIELASPPTPTLTRAPASPGQPQDTVTPSSTATPPPRNTLTVSPTPTLTTITRSPREVTVTPSRTATWTPSPSPTLTPGSTCPGAPLISSFAASAGKITQGQTSTLSWGLVSNATSVEIDHGVGGVPTPGSRTVSPSTTTTFTLTARGCGGTATRQVTILVTAPPTPTSTHTPVLDEPAAPNNLRRLSRSCSSPDQIRIAWNDNSNNESGFRIYRRLRSSTTWTNWSLMATVGPNSTQHTDSIGFGKFDDVEYGVEAYNAAGASNRPTVFVSECID